MKLRITLTSTLLCIAGLSVSAQEEKSSWADNIKVSGDIRLRNENIDQDGKEGRNRTRLRLRVKADAKINDQVKAGFRLASGESDPVSTNQTLDEGFSSKSIVLDRAFVIWEPEALGGLAITGGKMANPMVLGQDLVWDGDLNPEGVNFNYAAGIIDLNAGYYFVEERSSDDDTSLVGITAAADLGGEGLDINIGAGYFLYDNIKGYDLIVADDAFGNSTVDTTDPVTGDVTSSVYASDYALLEGFASIGFNAGIPVTIYADYVVNNDAETDADTAYQFGISLLKAKNPGEFAFDYNWRSVEADAVFASFTDSDFGGGGTDAEGHRISGKYKISKNWEAAATYFINELGTDGSGVDYNRLQLDLVGKF